jgi:hypothetical protein
MADGRVNRSSTNARRTLRRALDVAGVLVLAGLAAWEGGQGRKTAAAHWSVGAVIVAAPVLALVLGRRAQRETSRQWLREIGGALRSVATGTAWRQHPISVVGGVAWGVLIAAVVGWDLNSFAHQSHDLPTLSRFAGAVTRYWWGRSLVFAAWLALGVYLVAGWRLRRPSA